MQETSGKGCCNDEYKLFKIDNDQKFSKAAIEIPSPTSTAVITSLITVCDVSLTSSIEKQVLSKAPPIEQGLPLFIRFGVFRL